MDYCFEYKTKGGSLISMTADVDAVIESSCHSCDWPGCTHCPPTVEVNDTNFTRDSGKRMSSKMTNAVVEFFDTHHLASALDEFADTMNVEPDAD